MTIDRDLLTRDWSWGLLCASVPIVLVGAMTLGRAEEWWQYASGVIAIAGGVVFAWRGIHDLRLRALGRRTLAERHDDEAE